MLRLSFLQITRIQINDNLLFFLGKLNKYFVVILHNQLQKWHESHLRDNLLKVNHVNTLNCSNLIYIFCIAELRLEYKIRNRSGISFSIIQNKHKLYFFIDLNNSLKNITLIYMQHIESLLINFIFDLWISWGILFNMLFITSDKFDTIGSVLIL